LFQIVNNESEKLHVQKQICQNHTYVFKPQTCMPTCAHNSLNLIC